MNFRRIFLAPLQTRAAYCHLHEYLRV